MRYFSIIIISVFLQSCIATDVFTKAVDTGAGAYEKVAKAKAIKIKAEALKKATDVADKAIKVRQTKANTSKQFVEGIGALIEKQPIPEQNILIKKSIDAKITIAEKSYESGAITATAFWLLAFFLLAIFKYIFDRLKPKIKSASYE